MLFKLKATPAECRQGLKLAIERGWQVMHESGTYVKFTQTPAWNYRNPATSSGFALTK
jgi:hypothetical protein